MIKTPLPYEKKPELVGIFIWSIGGKRLFPVMLHRAGAEPCADASPQGFKNKLSISYGLAVEKNVCGASVRTGHAPTRCAFRISVCRK